jgi:hypothetical protein
MTPNLVDDLIKVRIPSLLSAISKYKEAARGLGSPQQILLSAEVERRIRQSIAILLRVDQLVSPTLDRALFTITEVVMHGTHAGQVALNESTEVTDEVWFLTEAFYWNAFRTLNIFWGQGIKIGEEKCLPGIGVKANRKMAVCMVRNQLVEHPEMIGESMSLGPYGSGPSIGSWTEHVAEQVHTDLGLFANAHEWISYVTRRLEVGVKALTHKANHAPD